MGKRGEFFLVGNPSWEFSNSGFSTVTTSRMFWKCSYTMDILNQRTLDSAFHPGC